MQLQDNWLMAERFEEKTSDFFSQSFVQKIVTFFLLGKVGHDDGTVTELLAVIQVSTEYGRLQGVGVTICLQELDYKIRDKFCKEQAGMRKFPSLQHCFPPTL